MTTEFSKLRNGFLAQDDFKGGSLGFLVETFEGEAPVHDGVSIQSKIGKIFTAAATYEGLKRLDNDSGVKRIEFSRPGGMA